MNLIKLLIVAAVLAVGSAISTAQAAAPDFSKLAGKYKATQVLTLGPTVVSGNVIVTIAVPKNGSKAAIQIVGYGSVPGTGTVALLGNIKLTSRRTINADNVLLALYVQLPAVPTHFVGSGSKLTYSLVSNSALGDGVMSYTLTFTGKRLNIVGNGTLGGTAASVVLQGKKQGK